MITKYLTLIPVIALFALTKQACALSVTVDPLTSVVGSEVTTSNRGFANDMGHSFPQGAVQDGVPFESTLAVADGGTATYVASNGGAEIDKWTDTQTGFDVFDFNGGAALHTSTIAGDVSKYSVHVEFTIDSAVQYNLVARLTDGIEIGQPVTFDSNGSVYMNALLRDTNGNQYYGGTTYLSALSVPNTGLPSASNIGNNLGSLTGTLAAGTYVFDLYEMASNGAVNAPLDWDLNLLTPIVDGGGDGGNGGGGNSVPDSGSTLMLLGGAFAAIGGIRHKLKI